MELYLAIVVISAVIFFGALISTGNERQRKAIDLIHHQIKLWAIHDLKIKQKNLAKNINIENPKKWLNDVATHIIAENIEFEVFEFYDFPDTLVCRTKENRQVSFSTTDPSSIRYLGKSQKNNRLLINKYHPLINSTKKINKKELTLLNNDIFFDIELSIVWQSLTGKKLNNSNSLWMYW